MGKRIFGGFDFPKGGSNQLARDLAKTILSTWEIDPPGESTAGVKAI